MKMFDNVLLSSGGMDSLLVGSLLKGTNTVHIFCDVGQKYLAKEYHAAIDVATICNAPLYQVQASAFADFENEDSGIIPFRNAELILNGAQYGNNIYLGVLADEINSDKSPEFFDAITSVLNISHRKQYWTVGEEFKIVLPLKDKSKTKAVCEYLENGSIADLLKTVSCYNDTEKHCGRCSSCFKRWVALTNATKTSFSHHFLQDPATWKTKEEWEKKFDSYSVSRVAEIVSAFEYAK